MTLLDTVDSMQCKKRDGNLKKDPPSRKNNATDQTEIKCIFDKLICRVDIAEERIAEFGDI